MNARNLCAALAALACCTAQAQDPTPPRPPQGPRAAALADLSLEELGKIEVTSVSGHAEHLDEAPASVYVITNESIRRHGATTLAEALRLAPNLQVARTGGGTYAISARGFNNAIGNKLLVLIDGRSVYAPMFSGVFWEQQDVMLEDVERIEVISGPGGTLWGLNAVNGVINVISRRAQDTQGALLSLAAGARERTGGFRYGTSVRGGHLRVYAKTSQQDSTRTGTGAPLADGQKSTRVGWRADWGEAHEGFTLQGDLYSLRGEDRGAFGPVPLGAVQADGANLLARWSRRAADGSDWRVQAWWDESDRDEALTYQPRERIVDLSLQHSLQRGAHRVLWGAGVRHDSDRIRPGLFFGFVPEHAQSRWHHLFIQDEWRLSERLELTAGTKLERNPYTGTEWLPSVRLQWTSAAGQMLWGALSRAVRAPARLDRDLRLPPQPPYLIAGGPAFRSEVARVAELGWRSQPTPALAWSLTVFHHDWDRLRSGQTPPGAQVQNMIEGRTWGAEAWAEAQPLPQLRLGAGLTVLRKRLRLQPGSTDPDGPYQLGNDPRHQLQLRAALTLPARQELDMLLRHVGALPQPAVPAYTALDVRWAWRMRPDLEFALVGRNLFDRYHPEFGAAASRAEFARSLLLQMRWTP